METVVQDGHIKCLYPYPYRRIDRLHDQTCMNGATESEVLAGTGKCQHPNMPFNTLSPWIESISGRWRPGLKLTSM